MLCTAAMIHVQPYLHHTLLLYSYCAMQYPAGCFLTVSNADSPEDDNDDSLRLRESSDFTPWEACAIVSSFVKRSRSVVRWWPSYPVCGRTTRSPTLHVFILAYGLTRTLVALGQQSLLNLSDIVSTVCTLLRVGCGPRSDLVRNCVVCAVVVAKDGRPLPKNAAGLRTLTQMRHNHVSEIFSLLCVVKSKHFNLYKSGRAIS